MSVKFSNNAVTTLSAGISAGATSFTVASASTFPTLASGDWTYVSLTSEVVKVTAISGTTFTCDATVNAHASGESVELRMTAELLNDFAEDTEALPLAGGTMTGTIADFTSTGIDDNATNNSLTLTDSAYTFTSTNSAPILKHETTHGSGIPLFDLKGAASTQIRYLNELGAVQTRIDMGDSGTTSFVDAASNVHRMRIGSAGNLLVGTTASNPYSFTSGGGFEYKPNGASSIARSGGNPPLALNNSDQAGKALAFRQQGNEVGNITTAGGTRIGVVSNASLGLGSYDTDGQWYLNSSSGYFGPGSSQDATLDLGRATARIKDLYLSGTAYANTYAHDGDSDTYFNFPAANQLSLVGGGAEIVKAYQIAGAYGVLKVNGSGSATYPNFTFNGDENTGMYLAGTDALAFTTGGTEKLRINSAGNLGVGTSNPQSRIDVGGGYMANEQGRTDHVANTMPSPYYHFNQNDYTVVGAIAGDFSRAMTIEFMCYPDHIQKDWANIFDFSYGSGNNGPRMERKGTVDEAIEYIIYMGNGANAWGGGTVATLAADKWHHVVFVITTTATTQSLTSYVNGVLYATTENTTVAKFWLGAATNLNIGRGFSATRQWAGDISKFRVYNEALSLTEIKEAYAGNSVSYKYKGASAVNQFSNPTMIDTDANGLADSVANYGTATMSIVTGNGFTGNAQRLDFNTGGSASQALQFSNTITHFKRSRISFKYRSNFACGMSNGNYSFPNANIPANTGNAVEYSYEFTHEVSGGTAVVVPTWSTSAGQWFEINDVVIEYIGAVAEYDGSSATTGTWYDKSGNGLDGTVTGATLENKGNGLAPVTSTAPNNPAQGDMWFDTTGNAMKVWSGSGWDALSNKFTATGGTESTSGGYKYHTFTSSGTFTAEASGSVDYLVIGGGGQGGGHYGGNYEGGGGGAGGYRTGSISVTAQQYTITIGAGAAASQPAGRNNGASSSFSSITSVGGGAGGHGTQTGNSGGSGGGSGWITGGGTGGSGTSGQGNSGGIAGGSVNGGGGGGGAGAVGANGINGGNGGNGRNSESAWATATSSGVGGYYAGGGAGGRHGSGSTEGGGNPGLGGGGTGRSADGGTAVSSGIANTGGGGGGHWHSAPTTGASGGSGIVIIRYAI